MKKRLVYGVLAMAVACFCLMGCGNGTVDNTDDGSNVEMQSEEGVETKEIKKDMSQEEQDLQNALEEQKKLEEEQSNAANLEESEAADNQENTENTEVPQEVAPEDAANEAAE